MKRLVYFLFFLSCWQTVNAQDKRDMAASIDFKKADTLINSTKIDSIHDAAQTARPEEIDSLSKIKTEIEAARLSTRSKIDSLKALGLPHEKYTRKLDSLNIKYSQNVTGKLSRWQQAGNGKVNELKGNVETTLQGNQGVHNFDLPSTADTNTPLPDTEINGINNIANSPEADFNKQVDLNVGNELQTDGFGGAAEEAKKITTLPEEKVKGIKSAEPIEKGQGSLDKIQEYSNRAGEYKEHLSQAKKGNVEGIEKRAEEEAAKNFDELGDLQQQSDKLEQSMNPGQKEAYVKQQIKEKAVDLVDLEFSQNLEKFEMAQNKLRRYKNKRASFRSFKGKKTNPLKEKTLKERMRFGLDFEILQNIISADFAPFMGYSLTQYCRVNIGYMYRFVFDADNQSFQWEKPVYGPRFFATYNLYKGFFGKASFEQLRTNVPRAGSVAETSRQWVNGGFLGIGKAYNISKRLRGNLQVLYNFLHSRDSPYPKKFNVRLGFNFGFKNKVAEVNQKD